MPIVWVVATIGVHNNNDELDDEAGDDDVDDDGDGDDGDDDADEIDVADVTTPIVFARGSFSN